MRSTSGAAARQFEQAAAQAKATSYDFAFVQLTVQTDLATYYFALRSLDTQDQILRKTVDAYREQVRIVSVMFKNGLTAQTDVYQAEALLKTTQAQQVDVERRADEEHALAIVCGRPAPKFSIRIDPMTQSPPEVPPGLPAQLLDQRPDVAEAEQNIVAANARSASRPPTSIRPLL